MQLGGKLLNSLRIKTQFLERLQSVSVVDGAAHTQNDDVESNGGSLERMFLVAKVFVLFLCGVQLVLRSGVLTALDLDEVHAMPRFAKVFGSVLPGVGGSGGGWRCCLKYIPASGRPARFQPVISVNLLAMATKNKIKDYYGALISFF